LEFSRERLPPARSKKKPESDDSSAIRKRRRTSRSSTRFHKHPRKRGISAEESKTDEERKKTVAISRGQWEGTSCTRFWIRRVQKELVEESRTRGISKTIRWPGPNDKLGKSFTKTSRRIGGHAHSRKRALNAWGRTEATTSFIRRLSPGSAN